MSILAAAVALVAGSGQAEASLVGDTVGCSITASVLWTCTTPTAVVGPGNEFELDVPLAPNDFGFFVDIDAASIAIASNENNAFLLGAGEVLVLDDLDLPGAVAGIANFSASGAFTAADVTFAGHAVSIDMDGFWSVGSFLSFDLIAADVPESGTLAMLVAGLAGIGFVRRRRLLH